MRQTHGGHLRACIYLSATAPCEKGAGAEPIVKERFKQLARVHALFDIGLMCGLIALVAAPGVLLRLV